MSQQNNTLRETLRQHLEELQETQEGNDLFHNPVEWILQELIELEFNEHFSTERYDVMKEARNAKRTATVSVKGIS